MNALQRPGRAAAVVGAVVAVSATSLIALMTGIASASEPGTCVETVNVRAQPSPTAPVVALCEAGTDVQVGETRNGFVQLVNLGGWSAQEFVSVNGAAPAAPGSRTTPGAVDRSDAAPSDSGREAGPSGRTAPAPGDTSDDATPSGRTAPAPSTRDDDGASTDDGAGTSRDGSSADESSAPGGQRSAPESSDQSSDEPETEPEAEPSGTTNPLDGLLP